MNTEAMIHSSPPRAFKPDYDEAITRLEAYFAGEMIDRPVVCVTACQPGKIAPGRDFYTENLNDSFESIVEATLRSAEATYFGREAMLALR